MNEMKNSSEDLCSLPPRPPVAPLKRRFVRLGARKTSDGSQLSASSTGSSSPCRSSEAVAVRQPSKNRIRRHTNRLSGVFHRGSASSSASMSLTAGLRSTLLVQARKGSMIPTDALAAEDPCELSNQITAPGILKIFGNEICEGAHYKSVLATTHSSAKELVKEALERYGLSKEEAESFVLCDTIGTTGSIGSHRWKTEGFRVVGDHEKPLLLQSLWKPREGLARRFEIQRRSSVEEKTCRDKDTVTAGINAQARKLQKSRSRVTSTFLERTVGRGHKLWRSKSEMDLLDAEGEPTAAHQRGAKDRSESLNQCPEQNGIQSPPAPSEGDGGSRAKTESHCPPGPRGGEESEREETESSDDNTTQYSIHPPQDCPYLLLLQGCCLAQDFVIYLLAASNVTIGHKPDSGDGTNAHILLSASDILTTHCRIQRSSVGGPTTICPCQDAVVTRNGEVLTSDMQLCPGDVIGVGQHYLLLFKDPVAVKPTESPGAPPDRASSAAPWMLAHTTAAATSNLRGETLLCNTCLSTCADLQRPNCRRPLNDPGPPFLTSPEGRSLSLDYETRDQERIVKEIVALGCSSINDRPPLTASFLLCMCVQHSAACLQDSDLRRLLLLIGSEVQSAVWEHTKDLAAAQSQILSGPVSNPEDLHAATLSEVVSGLRPLVVWMSNSLELLQVLQYQLPLIVEWRVLKEQGQQEEEEDEEDRAKKLALLELRVSYVQSATEETTAVLEEVIMLAFQQCVYYITKLLYPVLPGLLDCNPFTESTDQRAASGHDGVGFLHGAGGPPVPGEIRQVLEVLAETWTLLSDCQVHPQISYQLVGYLFYFINASLFNSLMERGSQPGFYQWSRGVRMRANLDLLLDWAHMAGLAELASEHTHTLSSAINLLATPRKNLLQALWALLRSDYPALSPAQLHHLLTLYRPASPCRHTWTPTAQDQAAAAQTADILESFDTHHPLVLPDGGYQLQLRRPVADRALRDQLDLLRDFICRTSDTNINVEHQMESEPLTDVPLNNSVGTIDTSTNAVLLSQTSTQHHPLSSAPSVASPPSPPSSLLTHCVDELSSCGAHILSQKLRKLALQSRETESSECKEFSADPSCLLTPPKTPQLEAPGDLVKGGRPRWKKAEAETSAGDVQDEGGLVFECLAALRVENSKSDSSSMKTQEELKEEQEEEEEERADDHHDDDDEVFSLELERGERGLGLALVDTRDTSMKVKGIFIRAVVPDSPAARCEKLLPGDRILAVNGVSLLQLDYHSGRELIQSSGVRLRLLVARSEWMVKAMQTEC